MTAPARIVVGVDPGPRVSGLVAYDAVLRRVVYTRGEAPIEDVCEYIYTIYTDAWRTDALLAIERVQSQGHGGADLFATAEVVGRVWQRALDAGWAADRILLVYRRQVCRVLDVAGGGRDAVVRQRMIEMHGGTRAVAVGTRRLPGPLYGVSGHAWQALGLAVAVGMLGGGRT